MTDRTRTRAEILACSELCYRDHKEGRESARLAAEGYVVGAAQFIEQTAGPLAAYEIVQRLADEIAERVPRDQLVVQRRRK